MSVCDAVHLFASYRILGPEVFFGPGMWRWEDWVNFGTFYGFGAARWAFWARVGFGSGGDRGKGVKGL